MLERNRYHSILSVLATTCSAMDGNAGTSIIWANVSLSQHVLALLKMTKQFMQDLIFCLQNEPALWHANSDAYKNKN